MKDSDQVRSTLSGYHLWAVYQLMDADGKTESEALATVVEHWLELERKDFLIDRGITRQAYEQARGKNVVRIDKKPG